jgi:hypothetical protein
MREGNVKLERNKPGFTDSDGWAANGSTLQILEVTAPSRAMGERWERARGATTIGSSE